MKKKQKPREKREAMKAAQKQKFAAQQAQKAPQEAQTPAEVPVPAKQPEAKKTDKPIKSRNKAAGLKSTFAVGDALFLTSFGKGNTAVPEYRIQTDAGFSVSPMTDDGTLKVKGADEQAVSFSGTRAFTDPVVLRADSPLHANAAQPSRRAGQDILGLKDKLERRYYGCTFDDNIHIQIIYNILDIEKILAVHITNLSAALNHLCDEHMNPEAEDFIGYMSTLNTYAVFMDPSQNPEFRKTDDKTKKKVANIGSNRIRFENLLKTKRLGYFGLEFDARSRQAEAQKKRLYHLMALIGQLRQAMFHDKYRTWLYQLDNKLDSEYLDTLNYYFDRRLDEINKHFSDQNKVNLLILLEKYPKETPQRIAKLYYEFIVVKAQKNLGFSIKTLREMMLDRSEAEPLKAQEMDTVRSKLYKLIDFCLFLFYTNNPKEAEETVCRLRACMTEAEKERVYSAQATVLWEKFKSMFLGFPSILTGKCIKDYQSMDLPKEAEEGFEDYRKSSRVSYFAKLMYVLCIFLDGKEINDLLTTLINKFDNIASLTECAKEFKLPVKFVPAYEFFDDSQKLVDELNIIRSIARMSKPDNSAKQTMFRDALQILGIKSDMTEEQLERTIQDALDPDRRKPHDFRNFIINNVINSTRFIYVIKFCNPESAREIVQHEAVCRFVLSQIPETQIARYHQSCIENAAESCTNEKRIAQLTDLIRRIDFGMFEQVLQKSRDRRKQLEKERFKAVIRLYLTVIYLVVKNLVNINARYVMGFHCLERDMKLYGITVDLKTIDYLDFADTLCGEGDTSRSGYLARNKRLRNCVMQDIQNGRKLTKERIRSYRNAVAHLNVIRNCHLYMDGDLTRVPSYYSLYQYLVQRYLTKKITPSDPPASLIETYCADLRKYHSYVKDFVKALNAPFGYNIPRFKNLTIESLFDRNNPTETVDNESEHSV